MELIESSSSQLCQLDPIERIASRHDEEDREGANSKKWQRREVSVTTSIRAGSGPAMVPVGSRCFPAVGLVQWVYLIDLIPLFRPSQDTRQDGGRHGSTATVRSTGYPSPVSRRRAQDARTKRERDAKGGKQLSEELSRVTFAGVRHREGAQAQLCS